MRLFRVLRNGPDGDHVPVAEGADLGDDLALALGLLLGEVQADGGRDHGDGEGLVPL